MGINKTLDTNLGQISNIISYIPKTLTEITTEFIKNNWLNVTERQISGFYLLFSFILLYVGIKILQKINPIIKFLILLLSIALILGILFIPW